MSTFVRACSLDDLTDGSARGLEIDGVEIAVVRNGEEVYAIQNECSHAQIPLSEGEIDGDEIECWLHGSMFDLRTGKAINLPATEPVPVYPVRISQGEILVDVTHPLPAP
ncbi:MAG TPA: non-heme iron oxygenase ferredoxin subunit [Nocardioidaceae bacterium]|nr:non-heme iron oxygenase ferredoxin subunit [Nocardioidaceae bacterium]